MNRLTKSLLASIGVFFAFYLAGSFGNASFNIATWVVESRGLIAWNEYSIEVISVIILCGIVNYEVIES